MKAFLLKYKRTIIFCIVFSVIAIYFAPRQHDFYLDDDIKNFKSNYLVPFLVWTGIVTSLIVFILVFAKTKSLKQSGISLFPAGVTLAIYLFLFQDLFLGGALFLNRQFKRDTVNKTYIISYMTGTDKTKLNLIPYDLATKHPSIDRKLINKLYSPGQNQNDTVTLTFDKGIFGIAFQSHPFNDK